MDLILVSKILGNLVNFSLEEIFKLAMLADQNIRSLNLHAAVS